jgi:formylmethanofuran dehydrogenase subunit E
VKSMRYVKCKKCGHLMNLDFSKSVDARMICPICEYATDILKENIVEL